MVISLIFLSLVFPFGTASAAGSVSMISESDPYNTIIKTYHYQDKGDHDVMQINFREKTVSKVYIASYNDDFSVKGTEKVSEAPAGRYAISWMFTCNTAYVAELYNSSGMLIYEAKFKVSGLVKPKCDSSGNEDQFEEKPPTCDICAALKDIRDKLNTNNNKLDQIIGKIPPPPNWQEVANTMRDTIVPKLVDDTRVMLDDLLGRAPAPPPVPVQPMPPENLDMPSTDKMPEAPSVDLPPKSQDNNFTADDVMKDAPELNYEAPDEEDEGFNLTIDPMENLENPGSPGKPKEPGDPGNPGVPNQNVEAPPMPNTPEYNPGNPGKPNQDVGAPGKPDDGNISPSNPGGNIGSPPGGYKPS